MKNLLLFWFVVSAFFNSFAETTIMTILKDRHPESEILALVDKVSPDMINAEDEVGNTLLHYAVENNYFQVAERLIKKGANVNHMNYEFKLERHDDHVTPLMRVFYKDFPGNSADKFKMAQLLLDNGADVDASNGGGWTTLFLAIGNNGYENDANIKLLIERGASVNFKQELRIKVTKVL